MGLTRIHVRRDVIAKDKKTGTVGKAIGVETAGKPKRYGRRVRVIGRIDFIYRPDKPLRCGARAWAETYGKVIVYAR